MKKNCLLAILILLVATSFAQNKQRYKNQLFTQFDSSINIQYGVAVNIKNQQELLFADFFSPLNDSVSKRPLVLFVHGGGFQNGDKSGGYVTLAKKYFINRGYTFASINYRLGIEESKSNEQYYEALYRAASDVQAAILYFKANANSLKIDTNNIFLIGSSAGSKSIMGAMYMPPSFVTTNMQQSAWGNTTFSATQQSLLPNIKGVINCWGALPSYNWLTANSTPLFMVHGKADKSVPFDSSYSYHGFNYGSLILYHQALKMGLPTGIRLFENTGHTLDNSSLKQDSALQEISAWMYTRLSDKYDTSKADKAGVLRYKNDIDAFDNDPLKSQYSKNAILVTGSSFIRYWTTIQKDLSPYEIIHRGYGGSNLSDMAFYINRILDKYPLKGVMIYVGNDIVVSKKDKTPLQVLELYKYIVEQIRAKHPNIPIVWAAICPSIKRWAVWSDIQVANQLVKNYSTADKNLYYIEGSEVFFKPNSQEPNPAFYREDKLHFNVLGYQKWTSVIQPALQAIFN